MLLPSTGFLIGPSSVQALGGAAVVHDIVVGTANPHMEAVARAGLLSVPTEYLPVVVAAGSYYVHPYDLTAIGAEDWNRGLQFLSAWSLGPQNLSAPSFTTRELCPARLVQSGFC